MSKVTNLNRFRKQKARDARRAAGGENAVKFGRSKSQKTFEETEAEKARRALDQHRKDD